MHGDFKPPSRTVVSRFSERQYFPHITVNQQLVVGTCVSAWGILSMWVTHWQTRSATVKHSQLSLADPNQILVELVRRYMWSSRWLRLTQQWVVIVYIQDPLYMESTVQFSHCLDSFVWNYPNTEPTSHLKQHLYELQEWPESPHRQLPWI